MSKTAAPQKPAARPEAVGRNRPASQEEFLSYEQIWQMTGGKSAETDAALLHQVKTQYQAAQKKANEIVLAAQAEAGRVEQEAFRKGFEQGREEGEQAGRQQFDKVAQRFAALFDSCSSQALHIEQAYQQKILELIKAMAERLAGIEVATNPAVIKAALEHALATVADNLKVRVRLNPADLRNLKEAGLLEGLAADSRLQLVEDRGVTAGGCLLSTDYGEVDATWETRRQLLFDAVEQAFGAALLEAGDEPPAAAPQEESETSEEADPWLL